MIREVGIAHMEVDEAMPPSRSPFCFRTEGPGKNVTKDLSHFRRSAAALRIGGSHDQDRAARRKALRQAERKGVQSAIGIVFDAMADVAAQDKDWWVVKDYGELIAAGDELPAEATENGKNGTYRTGFRQVFKDRAVAISIARTKTENGSPTSKSSSPKPRRGWWSCNDRH